MTHPELFHVEQFLQAMSLFTYNTKYGERSIKAWSGFPCLLMEKLHNCLLSSECSTWNVLAGLLELKFKAE